MSKGPKSKNNQNDNKSQDDGYPKQDVAFKFSFNLIQNELSDTLMQFQWVDPTNKGSRTMVSTDISKDWTKTYATDPKTLSYTKEFTSTVVNDDFIKNLCSEKFRIQFVSKTDQIILEKFELHYSPLLFPTDEPKIEFSLSPLKLFKIESLRLTITVSKPLLTPAYREYLNPMQISIINAKQLPSKEDALIEYKPAYAVCKFFDGTVIKTHGLPHSATCKWLYKQVVLLGLMSPIKLSEFIQTTFLEFEVHDRDEIVTEPLKKEPRVLADISYESIDPSTQGNSNKADAKKKDKDSKNKTLEKTEKIEKPKAEAKKQTKNNEPAEIEDSRKIKTNNYGVAHFSLLQFLETDTTSLKLQKNIVPIHKYEATKIDTEPDLASRQESRDNIRQADYFKNGSYLTVSYDLAYAIGPLKSPTDLPLSKNIKMQTKSTVIEPKQVSGNKVCEYWVLMLPGTQNKNELQSAPQPTIKFQVDQLRYERVVYLISTKLGQLRNEFLKEVRLINLERFGKTEADISFLQFKALSEKEKQDKDLDIITGVEFIDHVFHTFILEGLAEKSMKT